MKFYEKYADAMDLLTTQTPMQPVRLFDQLICYGTEGTCAYMLETDAGLVLLDALLPGPAYEQMFERALCAFGHKPQEIACLLISHGHFDHFGLADYLADRYKVKAYMSETDYRFSFGALQDFGMEAHALRHEPLLIYEDQLMPFGGAEVQILLTPGHTPGGLSFLFPVSDGGERHMAALWGGTSLPKAGDQRKAYYDSYRRFCAFAAQAHADVELCAHPFMDNGRERMALMRDRMDGIPNPFVLGRENYLRYEAMLLEMARNGCAESSAV